jgi:tRNA 5-methylaminomethyl-2-thiouridine biosynthesis bifunctional protein
VLRWTENLTPVSLAFDDIYYAKENGLEESRYVFLGFNRLAEKFSSAQVFHIAELGFGTGLNFLATYNLWQKTAPQNAILVFSSFEKFPLNPQEIRKALKPWPELSDLVESFLEEYEELPDGVHRFEFEGGRVLLDLWIGDASSHLKEFSGPVDAWYFDGFAPQKNPELWSEEIFKEVARCSRRGTSFATYASTGFVRRHLMSQGFQVRKTRGFGRKREMCFGEYERGSWAFQQKDKSAETLQIVGGGVSGLMQATRLEQKNVPTALFESESSWIPGASGNPLALVMPNITGKPSDLSEFSLASFLFSTRHYRRIERLWSVGAWRESGVLQILSSPEKEERYLMGLSAHRIPRTLAQILSKEEASDFAGIRIHHSAVCWRRAGFLKTGPFAQALSSRLPPSSLRLGQKVDLTKDRASTVLCSGSEAAAILKSLPAPWKIQRGQISYWKSPESLRRLRAPVVYGGYVLPAHDERQIAGSTYEYSDQTEVTAADHSKILRQAQEALKFLEWPQIVGGRAAVRLGIRDALPLLGIWDERLLHIGHGSKAYSHASWCAEVLSSELTGVVAPLGRRLRQSLHPQRFAPAN